jgi:hypothetical protein
MDLSMTMDMDEMTLITTETTNNNNHHEKNYLPSAESFLSLSEDDVTVANDYKQYHHQTSVVDEVIENTIIKEEVTVSKEIMVGNSNDHTGQNSPNTTTANSIDENIEQREQHQSESSPSMETYNKEYVSSASFLSLSDPNLSDGGFNENGMESGRRSSGRRSPEEILKTRVIKGHDSKITHLFSAQSKGQGSIGLKSAQLYEEVFDNAAVEATTSTSVEVEEAPVSSKPSTTVTTVRNPKCVFLLFANVMVPLATIWFRSYFPLRL